MANCTFLGLGVMGYPMAGHLAAAGHSVTVWNRTPAKAIDWAIRHLGRQAQTIDLACKQADFVFVCVGDDQDVYDVVFPAIEAMPKGGLIVDHTTASAQCARACSERASGRGIGFLDAPISGGEAGAQNGALTIMCGGAQTDFDHAAPIMDSYAKAMKLMGDVGAGQLTKMVNQICIAGLLQGLSEGISFAQKSGLNVDDVVEAIGQGAAQSWQMDNRARTMARGEYDFGFAIDWMRKDLGIALGEANKIGADLTVTAQIDQYYKQVQEIGGGRWDTSALLKRLKE